MELMYFNIFLAENGYSIGILFKELKRLGYDRYITIEREISGEKQIEDILKAKKYFEKVMEEI